MVLADDVIGGDRRALARAITLVESSRPDDRGAATALLDALLPETGGAARIGISGAPGAGKSTFIEAFGLHLIGQGHRLAVLAVDPSSPRSGGSILGDKTRMEELSRHPAAFVRPSPSGGALGGVARRTREALLVCEAAGFDPVLVETVGVGQSETEVDAMVDAFVLLVAPGGGDELQGIKRGITELADIVVVTKADGELLAPARHVAAEYRRALQLLHRKHGEWEPTVVTCSSVTGEGIDDVVEALTQHREAITATGTLQRRRGHQALDALWAEVRDSLLDRFRNEPAVAARLAALEQDVLAGRVSAAAAAAELLA
jgi:LAO/AO transport system kinase